MGRIDQISDDIHQRTRLVIMAYLHEHGRVGFLDLEQELGTTAGNLSRHLSILADAGMVTLQKGYLGTRPHTAVLVTPNGFDAFRAEVEILRKLVASADEAGWGE